MEYETYKEALAAKEELDGEQGGLLDLLDLLENLGGLFGLIDLLENLGILNLLVPPGISRDLSCCTALGLTTCTPRERHPGADHRGGVGLREGAEEAAEGSPLGTAAGQGGAFPQYIVLQVFVSDVFSCSMLLFSRV